MISLSNDLEIFSVRLQTALKKYLFAKTKSSKKLALDSEVLPKEISRYFNNHQSNFRAWLFYNLYQKNEGDNPAGAFQFAQGLEVLPHYLYIHQELGKKNKLEQQLKEYYRQAKPIKNDSASCNATIIGGDLISILAWERAIKANLPASHKINALKVINQIMEKATGEGFKHVLEEKSTLSNQKVLLNWILPWQCALAFSKATENQFATFNLSDNLRNFEQNIMKIGKLNLKPKLKIFLNQLLTDHNLKNRLDYKI